MTTRIIRQGQFQFQFSLSATMRQGQRQRQGPFAHCFLGVGGQSPLSTVSADDWVSLYVIIIRRKFNLDI